MSQYTIKRLKLHFSITAIACLVSISISAQTLTDTIMLREVKVQATPLLNKDQANGKRSQIDSMALQNHRGGNLGELLTATSPVFIKNYGRGALSTISIRGTAPSHTRVSWNDIELSNPMLGMTDFSLIPVYLIDKVEIDYGAASMSQTSGALGGAVQLQSKPDWTNKFTVKLLQAIGSYQSFDEFARIQFSTPKFQSVSKLLYKSSVNNFSYRNKLSPNIDPQTGALSYNTQTNRNAGYSLAAAMQDVYFRPNPKLFGQMHIWLQQSERSLPQLETNESLQDQSQNTQTDNTMRLATQWKYYNGPHRFHTKLSIAFNQLDYQLKIQNGGFDNIHTQIDSHSKVITTNAELGYNRAWGEKIQLDINANTKADKVNSLESVTQSGYHKTRQQHALYAGLSLQASKSIVTKISLRQEIYDTRISKPVGNVGIQWQPLATHNWILKVSAAYNEHKPSLNDLYFQPGGNPNLKTETSTNIEFGTSYQYENSLLGYSTDLSIYHAPVRNWILWLPNPRGFWEPTNVDKVRTYGLEYNLQAHYNINHWKFSTKANFGLNYSLNYGAPNHWADASLGKQLPYIPRRSANATATIGYKQWDLNYNFSHYSKRYTTTSNETETSLDYLYPYYMSDLSLSYQTAIRKSKLQLELKIYNLLDEEYHTVLQRPMPGINAQFTIALSY